MPRGTTVVTLLLAAAALLAGDARAQVYSWVDKDGTTHFQEEPPPEGQRARKLALPAEEPPPKASGEQKDAGTATRAGADAAAKSAPAPPRAAERPPSRARPAPSVVLYSTSWCPWCKKAREYFRSKGIAFTEHDIEADPEALKRKLAMDGNQSVPTAVIGDQVVRGFSPARYQAALEQR